MNILEIQEEVLNLKQRMNEIISTGEAEARELVEAEINEIAEIRTKIDALEAEIKNIDEENRQIEKENNIETKKEVKSMKLIEMINTILEGRSFSEDEVKLMAEARAEFAKSGINPRGQIAYRGIATYGDGIGKEAVAEDKMNLEVAVRNNLVATKMGADFLSGLVGDVSIPQYTGGKVSWKDEEGRADDASGSFKEVLLQPKRLTATIDVSKQFLLQTSADAEAILIRDLAAAVAEKLDMTIFGNGEGSNNTPAGIFAGVEPQKGIGEVNYDDVLELEAGVEEHNGHNYMFVVNPKVKFALKGTQTANGLQMVFNGNEIDGYKTISSNSVVDKGIVCMDPHELVIGQWGSYDITIDPYTRAADGQVRLVINAYFDAKLRGNKVAKKVFA